MKTFNLIVSTLFSLGGIVYFFILMNNPTEHGLFIFLGILVLASIFFLFYVIDELKEENSELRRRIYEGSSSRIQTK